MYIFVFHIFMPHTLHLFICFCVLSGCFNSLIQHAVISLSQQAIINLTQSAAISHQPSSTLVTTHQPALQPAALYGAPALCSLLPCALPPALTCPPPRVLSPRTAAPPCHLQFGVGVTRVLECPKQMVGRVIGKAGETIKGLQKQFAASIQIDQNEVPCKITITGPSAAVVSAERAILDIIDGSGGPPGHVGGAPQGGSSSGYPGGWMDGGWAGGEGGGEHSRGAAAAAGTPGCGREGCLAVEMGVAGLPTCCMRLTHT